jgi:hypothetical protein
MTRAEKADLIDVRAIRKDGQGYLVPSCSDPDKSYRVTPEACSCPSFRPGKPCKHWLAVERLCPPLTELHKISVSASTGHACRLARSVQHGLTFHLGPADGLPFVDRGFYAVFYLADAGAAGQLVEKLNALSGVRAIASPERFH